MTPIAGDAPSLWSQSLGSWRFANNGGALTRRLLMNANYPPTRTGHSIFAGLGGVSCRCSTPIFDPVAGLLATANCTVKPELAVVVSSNGTLVPVWSNSI